MIIYKYLDFSQEVELDISSEDIHLILDESDDLQQVLRNISSAGIYLKSIPDKMIEQMNPAQKETISTFLTGLIERLKSGKD